MKVRRGTQLGLRPVSLEYTRTHTMGASGIVPCHKQGWGQGEEEARLGPSECTEHTNNENERCT